MVPLPKLRGKVEGVMYPLILRFQLRLRLLYLRVQEVKLYRGQL